MKALVSKAPGGTDTLNLVDLPDPVPGPGEVRIAVKACGVNYPDVLIIEDRYQFRPERPFAPGSEVSGVVDAVGDGVTQIKVGDRVIGGGIFGGLAEKMVVKAESCHAMPKSMPFDEAAALLTTYGTSHHALKDRARLRAGESLLVLGAAGGVGLAAVELGKIMGAKVIAAVSSETKADAAREAGADEAVIYPARSSLDRDAAKALTDQFRKAAGGAVDVIYDAVGGGYAEPALRTMAWDGRYLVVGFPAGIPSIPLNLPLLKGCSITGVFWGGFVERFPEQNRANVQELLKYYEDGKLRPRVSQRLPLSDGGTAIRMLAERRAIGKVVVTID